MCANNYKLVLVRLSGKTTFWQYARNDAITIINVIPPKAYRTRDYSKHFRADPAICHDRISRFPHLLVIAFIYLV